MSNANHSRDVMTSTFRAAPGQTETNSSELGVFKRSKATSRFGSSIGVSTTFVASGKSIVEDEDEEAKKTSSEA